MNIICFFYVNTLGGYSGWDVGSGLNGYAFINIAKRCRNRDAPDN